MPFMFLILAFLLWAVVWGFFHANPRGVDTGRLLAINIAILAAGLALALVSAIPLYGDALASKPDHKAVAAYLAIMAGGSAFMIVVASGGLFRNLFLFPLKKRGQDPFSAQRNKGSGPFFASAGEEKGS
jgi:cytochrome c oxidase assembly factor CtaG